jgi:hypothetical protein
VSHAAALVGAEQGRLAQTLGAAAALAQRQTAKPARDDSHRAATARAAMPLHLVLWLERLGRPAPLAHTAKLPPPRRRDVHEPARQADRHGEVVVHCRDRADNAVITRFGVMAELKLSTPDVKGEFNGFMDAQGRGVVGVGKPKGTFRGEMAGG